MLFNSLSFLLFALIFYAVWPAVRRHNQSRWIFIVVASLVFYGWWDWRYISLLLLTGFVDYLAGLLMEARPAWRKPLLLCSLGMNLGTLGAFKYSYFFATNIDALLAFTGIAFRLQDHIPGVLYTLPVGISFYTFQSMSYTIDVYRGHIKATRDIMHFFAYLSLFPQLVAGPIVRAADLLPGLRTWRIVDEEQRWSGTRLVAAGYFKKTVLADNLAPLVNLAFSGPVVVHSPGYWWIAVLMFAFQIYFDFSGYSDIARGLARWMGYDFVVNFDHPYTSTSLREFWSRWHISLSTWFRDYVYIPLGGSRGGALLSIRNLWITILASALWHGADWKFVIWGSIHAFFLSIERMLKWPEKLGRSVALKSVALILVSVQVLVAWVFFRATNTAHALAICREMFTPGPFVLLGHPYALLVLGSVILWEMVICARRDLFVRIAARLSSRWQLVQVVTMGLCCVFLRGQGGDFIYFQF